MTSQSKSLRRADQALLSPSPAHSALSASRRIAATIRGSTWAKLKPRAPHPVPQPICRGQVCLAGVEVTDIRREELPETLLGPLVAGAVHNERELVAEMVLVLYL